MIQYTPQGTDAPEIEVYASLVPVIADLETAIRIIQMNERGRIGIKIATTTLYKRRKRIEKRKREKNFSGIEDQQKIDRDNAINTIRKYYRGYCVR